MADPPLHELITLCERVLAVEITPEELARLWSEKPDDPTLSEVRETLFSGLEHLPGRPGNDPWQLDPDAWRTTPEYGDIEFFLARLRELRSGVGAARRSSRRRSSATHGREAVEG